MAFKLFAATKAFIECEGKILVLRESSKDPERVHIGKYDVPGGRINPGESFDSCLIREVREETGLEVKIEKIFFVNESWPKIGSDQYQVVRMFFVCSSDSISIKLSDEHDHYLWIDPKRYKDYNIIENLFPAFEEYLKFHYSKPKSCPGIFFTMGPASKDSEVIEKILSSGATGVRLTFSYSNFEYHLEKAKIVKEIAQKLGKKCKVIADLEGGKVRLGDFGSINQFPVKQSDKIILIYNGLFDAKKKQIPIRNKDFVDKALIGDKILLGDGSVVLQVENKETNCLVCNSLNDGIINPNRGIVLQSYDFQPESITQKDVEDLKKIANYPELFDSICLSFTSSAEDIMKVKEIVGNKFEIISKIETKRGIENLKPIALASDCIMIARGDLCLFLPWFELGNIVDNIVSVLKEVNKPWIMATQLVEGLERFSFPTRSEICDITRWVKEGCAGFLVSYETAFGSRPVDAINCLSTIIEATKDKN